MDGLERDRLVRELHEGCACTRRDGRGFCLNEARLCRAVDAGITLGRKQGLEERDRLQHFAAFASDLRATRAEVARLREALEAIRELWREAPGGGSSPPPSPWRPGPPPGEGWWWVRWNLDGKTEVRQFTAREAMFWGRRADCITHHAALTPPPGPEVDRG